MLLCALLTLLADYHCFMIKFMINAIPTIRYFSWKFILSTVIEFGFNFNYFKAAVIITTAVVVIIANYYADFNS
jgi:hypothetical protein